jgi:ethanolamine utilization protein EutN
MFVGKVTGSLVSTQKVPSMQGQKMLLVEPYCLDKETQSVLSTIGKTFVAVDTVGAGEGEFVLVVQGSSARLTPETKSLPVDAAIVGIIDTVHAQDKCVYNKEETT